MKKTVAVALVLMFVVELPLEAGLGSDKTLYVGGTVKNLKELTEGRSSAKDDKVFVFSYSGGNFQIPYERVNSLEYGQKAGRRVGATIGWGVTTLGVAALPLLFSKKRKHYLSIGYTGEDGKAQGVVLQLGKDVTRPTLFTLETRTGKQIEYESDEAKKHVGN